MNVPLKKEYLPIALIAAFAGFMIRLDGYIVNVALPSMARSLGVGTGGISFVVTSYLLAITGTMLLFGKLADKIGIKKMFLWGYAVFSFASLCCGLSGNLVSLLVSRSLQGLGGAMLLTAAFSSIPRYLPKEINGWAFGLFTLAVGLGVSVGAPAGGLIAGLLSWPWIFMVNVPVGILAMVAVHRILPPDPEPALSVSKSLAHFDIQGAALSFASAASLVFAMTMGREIGWTSVPILSCLAASPLLLAVFIRHEMNHPDPLVPAVLVRNRPFMLGVGAAFVGFGLLSANSFVMPFYLEIVKSMPPEWVGFVLLLYSVTLTVASPQAGKLADRIDPRFIASGALACLTALFLGFSLLLRTPGLGVTVIYLACLGGFFGFFFPANNSSSMREAPPECRGIAGGLYQTAANMGMVMCVSLFETIFSEHLPAHHVEVPLTPNHLTDEAMTGFSHVYLTAAFFSLLASLALCLSVRFKRSPRPGAG